MVLGLSRSVLLLAATATVVFASAIAPAQAFDHSPLFTDAHGSLAATRPGYYMGYVNGVAQSNAKQPITHAKAGFPIGKLPKFAGRTQGRWRVNGSNALGVPNALRKHRFISLYQGGYVSFSVNGVDPSTTVDVYLISNANPLAAIPVGTAPVDALGEVPLTTFALPTTARGTATVELVGRQDGKSSVIVVGTRVS